MKQHGIRWQGRIFSLLWHLQLQNNKQSLTNFLSAYSIWRPNQSFVCTSRELLQMIKPTAIRQIALLQDHRPKVPGKKRIQKRATYYQKNKEKRAIHQIQKETSCPNITSQCLGLSERQILYVYLITVLKIVQGPQAICT